MPPMLIVENEYITLQYEPEKKLIHHTIHKPIPDQPLIDALNAGTEALKTYGVCKWLSDDRKNGPLSPAIQEWGLKDWEPRTIAAGWKFWANVVPQKLVAAGALMPVIQRVSALGLRLQVFTNLEPAIEWLDSRES